MGKELDDLERIIEVLRLQLYNEVAGKRSNIKGKKVLKMSTCLDKLIVEWTRNYLLEAKRETPTGP
ncbi:MAG: aspartyl-phosphate phosphatase Spo0E family protein [Firmicutes bacterium]|nr:aspartyl-phosphate phosphatase Spo0E family protein [Bacillota bacterium]